LVQTEFLYMKSWKGEEGVENPNYIKEFNARILERGDDYVVLDQTAFYSVGGGQPSDTGILVWEGGESKVKEVIKKNKVKHFVETVPQSDDVHGVLDWNRRYGHMKMHTAQHVISGVVFDSFDARTVGNQIHVETSRVDFHPLNLSPDNLMEVERKCNDVISKNAVVKLYEEARESLEQRVNEQRCNLDLLPKSIKSLRIVEIEGFDVCPCAGTHVKNTSEIGAIRILKKENKGKERERIIYRLA
jgi:misacylated tRNA(Ala) deacylase